MRAFQKKVKQKFKKILRLIKQFKKPPDFGGFFIRNDT